MPNADNRLEAVVKAAYESQVHELYKHLATNLADAPVTHRTEKECVESFSKGIEIAKRAKDLALSVVAASSNPVAEQGPAKQTANAGTRAKPRTRGTRLT